MEQVKIKSVSHITGGGFYENIPRSLPKGMTAKIREADVPVLPIFDLIQAKGNVPRPGDVQHLQHGHRHDRGGGQGGG